LAHPKGVDVVLAPTPLLPRVHVLGRVPDDELGVILRRAAALVMP
jgi:hypothetical protein